MTETHTPGTPPVYHEAGDANARSRAAVTNIDGEAPEQLSPDQMDRHVGAVTTALRAHGLEVHECGDSDPRHLRVDHPDSDSEVELWLDDDRSAVFETFSEMVEGTTSAALAGRIADAILGAAKAG